MSTISASTTSTTAFKVTSDTTGTLVFQTGAVPTTAISIDASQAVGIGTSSPSDILTLAGGASGSYGLTINNAKVGGGTKAIFQYDATNQIALVGGNTTNGLAFQTLTGGSLTTKATIDSSGNLGLGVTPSAWSGVGAALQVGTSAAIIGNSVSSSSFISNAYFDGTNYRYIGTGFAMRLALTSGAYAFTTAPSGTAGNTISFTQAMTLDASGNLGIGTTSPASKLHVSNAAAATRITITDDVASGRSGYIESNFSDALVIGTTSGVRGIRFSPDNTPRMFLDTSGNLGIGTSSPSAKLHVVGSQYRQNDSTNSFGFTLNTTSATTTLATLFGGSSFGVQVNGSAVNNLFINSSGNLSLAEGNAPTQVLSLYRSGSTNAIMSAGNSNTGLDGTWFGVDTAGNGIVNVRGAFPLLFSTSALERARILSSGEVLAGATAAVAVAGVTGFHALSADANNKWAAVVRNTNSSTPFGLAVNYSAAAPNNTSSNFVYCYDSGALRASIRANGGLANYSANDVNLSDERTKKDIVPLGSMWDKFKAIEIVAFKYKDQTHEDNNIGVIAQQVESVAPEFVDVDGFGDTPEDGVPLKTIYTADMYHAAIKALQEAMTRIEQLEAKVAALESK